MASQRETGGVGGCGGNEEDYPVTRETHDLPSTGSGTGDPQRNPDAPDGSGRLPGRLRISVHAKVGTPREDRRRSRVKVQAGLAGLADEAWESDGCIRATMVGNGWHPDPAEQRRPVPRESFRRET